MRRGAALLALSLQEPFTTIARLRANRQVAADAESFRTRIKQVLAAAEQEARQAGYAARRHSSSPLFAVIAFLDETVLNSGQPMFADWPRRPLQQEVFGVHMAGELFFQYLQQLLGRQDSEDLADVLEVYELCLLLGFKGRYSASHGAELQVLARTALGEDRPRAWRHRASSRRSGDRRRPRSGGRAMSGCRASSRLLPQRGHRGRCSTSVLRSRCIQASPISPR